MADFQAVFASEQPVAYEPQLELTVDAVSELTAIYIERYYFMRAYHTVLSTYVHWRAVVTPDFVGSQSGYTPADLSDIVLLRVGRT